MTLNNDNYKKLSEFLITLNKVKDNIQIHNYLCNFIEEINLSEKSNKVHQYIQSNNVETKIETIYTH